jgi:hypothetical protein
MLTLGRITLIDHLDRISGNDILFFGVFKYDNLNYHYDIILLIHMKELTSRILVHTDQNLVSAYQKKNFPYTKKFILLIA